MGNRLRWFFAAVCWAWVAGPGVAWAGSPAAGEEAGGMLEVDSNMAGVRLSLCPKDQYRLKESRVFFGLIKSESYVCFGGEIPIGETPLKPTTVSPGRYVLLFPPDYEWEREGTPEVTIVAGEKTYFLLKLFSSRANPPESNHGGGGGGGGGGGAR